MAGLIPAFADEQLRAFRSRAEARFYEACRDQLPADVVVIHSTSWLYRDARGRLREGEADFTILVPQTGVLAVEVKGGGVAFDASTGRWYSVDREGHRNEIKDPFKQASDERHALLDQLTGHSTWRKWAGTRMTLGHAVMLPDICDSTALRAPDKPKEIIGVNADVRAVRQWLDRVMRFWKRPEDNALGAQGVRLVEDILCKSIDVRPALRATVDDNEQQRLRLTANQAKILRTIGGRRRAVVSGGAGTGKTVLAVEKAKQLAHVPMNVLFLCYNRPLADAIAIGLQDEPKIQTLSFHQLCDRRVRQVLQATGKNLLEEAKAAYPGSSDERLFEVQMPYALALSNEILVEKFDAIVVDEAQDFSDEYWFSVEELLRDQDAGYLYIFIDENQALYPRHGNLPVVDEPFYLTSNCRNTAPIHDAGYAFYAGEPIDGPDLPGPAVERIVVEGDDAQADAIVRQVHQWVLQEALRPEDVAVLIAKRPKVFAYELLQARGHAAGIAWSMEVHGRARHVLVDTVARFKGLESQAVVLWFGDEVVNDMQWESVYVGITRAKSLLAVVGSKGTLKSLRTKGESSRPKSIAKEAEKP